MKDLERSLRSRIKKYNVPGASVAVLKKGRVTQKAAAGVINLDTGVEATPDALFQIGSITKVLTATMIMQLVEEGLVDLDKPLKTWLPGFRVARADVSKSVTLRQLLCHTSGIDGDFFENTGTGSDSVERLLLMGRMLPSLYDPGAMMSYCNFGYAALGRLIEVLRGTSWDDALQKSIFDPLGMTGAFSRPQDALKFRAAIGHVDDPRRKGKLIVAPTAYLSLGQKAAGATPAMTASDLLKFVAMHMNKGRLPDGKRFLKVATVREMQKRQIDLPPLNRSGVDGWGLGWFLMNWQGERLYGHDGATMGQNAFLRVLPSKELAVVVLTNGGDMQGLAYEVLSDIFKAEAGLTEPELPDPLPSEEAPDLAPFAGTYSNMNVDVEVTVSRGKLYVRAIDRTTGDASTAKKHPMAFVSNQTARYVTGNAITDRGAHHFTDMDEEGRPAFMQSGFRRYRRTA